MSVLIGMLNDLDQRGQNPQLGAGMAATIENSVRAPAPVRATGPRRTALWLALILAVILLAVLAGRYWPGPRRDLPNPAAPLGSTAAAPAAVLPAPPPVRTPEALAPAPSPMARPTAIAAASTAAPTRAASVHPVAPGPTHAPAVRASATAQAHTDPATPAETVVHRSGSTNDEAFDLARAYELAGRGRNTEAIEILRRSVHDWPYHHDSRSALATLLSESGQRAEALAVLLDGVEVDPGHFGLAAARLQADLGNAVSALSTAERVPPAQRDAEYYGLAAAIAQRAGHPEVAVPNFRLALADAHPKALWRIGLGVALEQTGQPAQALEAYRQARAQGGVSPTASDFVRQRIAALATGMRAENSAATPRAGTAGKNIAVSNP